MKNFSKLQTEIITNALNLWSDSLKNEITSAEEKGKVHLFSPRYVDDIVKGIHLTLEEQNKRTKEEEEQSEEMFFNALCNGLHYIQNYGLYIERDEQYNATRKDLINPCIEDVLMAILRNGGTLVMLDDEDEDARYEISLADVHERVPNAPKWAINQMISEDDDASTADVIIQTVFLNEVVFG